MCDQCEQPSGERGGITRRALLALGAVAAGGMGFAVLNCRQEPKQTEPVGPATTPATAPAITEPAPDLGAEVFPDASGKAIAKPSDAPVIILPRSDWTQARPNLADIRVMDGVHRITVHHTAWEMRTDEWRPTAGELENIREFHAGQKVTDRKWADIAYHFVVDRAGRVWQARPLAYQGAHVRNHNEHNLGIVLLGNFEVQRPAAAQLVALTGFIGFVRRLYDISILDVFTHGELGLTSCPGKHLQAFMNRARRKWAAAEGITIPANAATTSRPTWP